MTNPTNFFVVPAALSASAIICKSGNSYTPTNSLIENVLTGDILDVINQGCRQVAGVAPGAQLSQVAGRFYNPVPGATPGTFLLVASTLYAFPFRVPANINIQTLNADVTTLEAGSNIRFGLYQDLNGAPGPLVSGSDSGTQPSTSGGVVTFTPSSPLTLEEGWYWGAMQGNTSGTMATVAAIAASYNANLNAMLGQDTAAHAFATSGEAAMGVSASATFGAMPANFPTATLVLNAAVPLIVLGT